AFRGVDDGAPVVAEAVHDTHRVAGGVETFGDRAEERPALIDPGDEHDGRFAGFTDCEFLRHTPAEYRPDVHDTRVCIVERPDAELAQCFVHRRPSAWRAIRAPTS